MSWYNKGLTGEHHDAAEKEKKKDRVPFRFYLKAGEEKKLVLLDDEGFFFFEHTIKLAHTSNFIDNFTCGKGFNEKDDPGCYLCDCNYKRDYIGLLTCVVLTPEYGRDGTEYLNSVRVFPMKKRTKDRFTRYKKRHGSLVGIPFLASRSSARVSSVGDDFQFFPEEKFDPFTSEKAARKDWNNQLVYPEIIDYSFYFEPKSNAEIRRIINDGMEEDWDSGSSGPIKDKAISSDNNNEWDDDIPF